MWDEFGNWIDTGSSSDPGIDWDSIYQGSDTGGSSGGSSDSNWTFDPNLDSDPTYNGSVQYPNVSGGTNRQYFDDGSYLDFDSNGNVIGGKDSDGGNINTSGSNAPVRLDQFGRWLNAAGQVVRDVATVAAPYAAALGTRAWMDMLSGGYFGQARDYITNAYNAVNNVQGADLTALIPTLQTQVMQGQMTPAQAQAAFQTVVGTMTPAQQQVFTAAMQGKMDPASAAAAMQADSEMKGVTTDAASIAGQRQALARLADIAENKGLTEADRAQLTAIMNQTNANAASQRAAQIQQLQMQGNAGTGAELAARLAGGQQIANANAAAGAQTAQSAQARALAALQAGLAGNAQLNQQLFAQDAEKAKAQDIINQFNTAAKNTVALQNAANQQQANQINFGMANQIALANQAAQNQAAAANAQFQQGANQANFNAAQQAAANNAQMQQAANLANANFQNNANQLNFNMANQIAGRNVDIQNQQRMLPLQTAQQTFQNRLDQASTLGRTALTGAQLLNNQGKIFSDAANANFTNTRNAVGGGTSSGTTGGTRSSGGGGGGGGGSWVDDLGKVVSIGSTLWSLFSDEDLKEDKQELSDADVDKMFGDLTGYKYRYKGNGNKITQGVMAQDVEKGPMGDSVVDTPAGKMLAGNEMFGKVLAAVANHNERLQQLEGKK